MIKLTRLSLLALAILAIAAGPAAAARTRPAVALTALESSTIGAINQVRAAHGLVPVVASVPLTQAARSHSTQMAAKGYFAHESADGTAFWKRIQVPYGSGGRSLWSVGENLVWAAPDLDASHALQLWLASPEHRKNILTASWREIGISAVHADAAPGVYGGQPVTIITTDFGVRR
jgi:uncharacterized protein YkwD